MTKKSWLSVLLKYQLENFKVCLIPWKSGHFGQSLAREINNVLGIDYQLRKLHQIEDGLTLKIPEYRSIQVNEICMKITKNAIILFYFNEFSVFNNNKIFNKN